MQIHSLIHTTPLRPQAASLHVARTDNGWQRSASVTFDGERTFSQTASVQRQPGSVTYSQVRNGPDGLIRAVESERIRTENGKTRTDSITFADGQHASRTTGYERSEDTLTANYARTGFDGTTRAVRFTATPADGHYEASREVTLADGSTASQHLSYQRTEDGWTRTAFKTGSLDIET
jgi:hypothetical protein